MNRSIVWGVVAWGIVVPAMAQEPMRQVLTNVATSTYLETWQASSKMITPGCPTPWTIRKGTLHGGKQDGVDVISVDNGRLKLTLIPTRGMGILRVDAGDLRLGWDSPVKEVVHPRMMNLQMRGGLGWLEGFNEWMCRCGLESSGHPGTDTFINNVGEEAKMELTLHGRIANLPAQFVEVEVDRKPPYTLRLRGRVDETLFHGPKLSLSTELITTPGSNRFTIADVITNRSAQPHEFQILYHVNYGRPLLEEGSTLVAPVARVTPFNAHAAKGMAGYATYRGPTPGFVEEVYCLRLHANADKMTTVLLQNRQRDRGVAMSYSTQNLPYLTVWKNTAAESDGYVTGIEPGTHYPYNRRIERQQGRVSKLAGGAEYAARLEFEVLTSAQDVAQARSRIDAIQAGRTPVIDREPMKVE